MQTRFDVDRATFDTKFETFNTEREADHATFKAELEAFNTEREADCATFKAKFEAFKADNDGVVQGIQRELEQIRELSDSSATVPLFSFALSTSMPQGSIWLS